MQRGDGTDARWTFLTNHAHVLSCIASDPTMRVREIAIRTGITERAAQRIIRDLEAAGYLSHRKVGRRNHYQVADDRGLHAPAEQHLRVGPLLRVLTSES